MGSNFKTWFKNGCHDLTVLYLSIIDIVIITVQDINYHCIIHEISESEAVYLLENSVLDDRGHKQNAYQKSQY